MVADQGALVPAVPVCSLANARFKLLKALHFVDVCAFLPRKTTHMEIFEIFNYSKTRMYRTPQLNLRI